MEEQPTQSQPQPYLFDPLKELLRQLTPVMIDALLHANRCGYLVRYTPTSRRIGNEDIWTHWDSNENTWWINQKMVERLLALGALVQQGPDEVHITPIGREAIAKWQMPPEPEPEVLRGLTNTL